MRFLTLRLCYLPKALRLRAAVIGSGHVKRRGRDLGGEDFFSVWRACEDSISGLSCDFPRADNVERKSGEAQTEVKNAAGRDSNVCKA